MESRPDQEVDSRDLAAKTVKGSAYSIAASGVTMVLGFGRSVLMARLLLPEHFGVVAFALTFLNFTRPLRDFGIDQALIHRKPSEELPVERALGVHFTLRLVLMGLFLLLLMAAVPVLLHFYPRRTLLVPVLLALAMGEVIRAPASTPSAYLRKEMRFKELGVVQVLTSLSMTVVGPFLAWQGYGVWAIVGEQISGSVAAALGVWALVPPWRFRWSLDWTTVKWYLNYGKFVSATRALNKVITEFDNFWVGIVLGPQPLGFYSRAYEFAKYPRRVVSDPLAHVLFPAFAKVQDDKPRLSKAYYRASSLIVRVGFLVGGMVVLAAHEFVVVFLGSHWIPMVLTLQLMIVYVLLEPLESVSGYLVNAVGRPDFFTRARAAQSIISLPVVVLGAHWWGIEGVAVGVGVILVVGLSIILYQIRDLVQVSFLKMLLYPTVGVTVALLVGWQVSQLVPEIAFLKLIIKTLSFGAAYTLIMLVLEGKEYLTHSRVICQLLGQPIRRSGTPDR